MPEITLLSQETIDKIAAGEVVERPSSVVKELVENAIDAKATAVTVEIKEGGISFIRITDNGCGIPKEQVPIAFLRHSTSKIKSVEDLMNIHSLGFRGEALSSIAAVSQVELITKPGSALTGTRYVIEGSKEKENEEIGAPDGTTFIVRNLFYNVPARRKFLKTAQTEAGYISDLMEHLALSHPDISFKFINNGQTRMHTSGNSKEKDLIYHIYGRDIAASILPVSVENALFSVQGFLGKPIISRGNRNYENYFINGRYIKSSLLSKAIEEAYKGFLMQHQYPFCVLYLTMDTALLDVNVHPTKMELRFSSNEEIYRRLLTIVRDTLSHKNFIPDVPVEEEKAPVKRPALPQTPEPFERSRLNDIRASVQKDSPYELKYPKRDRLAPTPSVSAEPESSRKVFARLLSGAGKQETVKPAEKMPAPSVAVIREENSYAVEPQDVSYEQQSLESVSEHFMTRDGRKRHKMIGQLFDTYWLIEYEDKLFIIDQHAAHEKVLYERTMKKLKEQSFTSQNLSPPIILSLNAEEVLVLEKYQEQISAFGYAIEPFGGKEYAITAIPADFTGIDMRAMFIEMLDDFSNISGKDAPNVILEKVASMSCKAAIKGNQHISRPEMEELVDALLELENPYNCPHGRPTIISMSKYEIEKKFKRIV
ncbi:MAG: DNA mismatch repair endonuclease MutL [Roseburia sp.]